MCIFPQLIQSTQTHKKWTVGGTFLLHLHHALLFANSHSVNLNCGKWQRLSMTVSTPLSLMLIKCLEVIHTLAHKAINILTPCCLFMETGKVSFFFAPSFRWCHSDALTSLGLNVTSVCHASLWTYKNMFWLIQFNLQFNLKLGKSLIF